MQQSQNDQRDAQEHVRPLDVPGLLLVDEHFDQHHDAKKDLDPVDAVRVVNVSRMPALVAYGPDERDDHHCARAHFRDTQRRAPERTVIGEPVQPVADQHRRRHRVLQFLKQLHALGPPRNQRHGDLGHGAEMLSALGRDRHRLTRSRAASGHTGHVNTNP